MPQRTDLQHHFDRLNQLKVVDISIRTRAQAQARLKAVKKLGDIQVSSQTDRKARAKVRAIQAAKRAHLARQLSTTSPEQRKRLKEISVAGRKRVKEIFDKSRPSRDPKELLRDLAKASKERNAKDLLSNTTKVFRGRRTNANTWPARFIIRTGKSTKLASVRKIIANIFGLRGLDSKKGIQLETLFRQFRTDRYFLLTVPLPRRAIKNDRFAIGRAIKAFGKFESVQPERVESLVGFQAVEPEEGGTDPDTVWHLRKAGYSSILDAWNRNLGGAGEMKGRGVVIGHPDTGWRKHSEYDEERLDLERAHNVLTGQSGANAARHPLELGLSDPEIAGGLPLNLTHGTALGSVIVSREANLNDRNAMQVVDVPRDHGQPTSSPVELTGAAPEATIIPVRCANTVILVTDLNLASAIEYLMGLDPPPDVISISMGGVPHHSLEEVIREAVRIHNIIVIAASGQEVQDFVPNNSVIEPGAYADVICAAGTTSNDKPWLKTCRGPEVDISAPARAVWCADFVDGKEAIVYGNGTSFSAALTAGVAALWVGFWGRERLRAQYPTVPLAHVFRHLVRKTARVPRGWNTTLFGAGIIDAAALLDEDLPEESEIVAPPPQGHNPFSLITDGVLIGEAILRGSKDFGEDVIEETRGLLEDIIRTGANVGGFLLSWAQRESQRLAEESEEFYGNLWVDAQATLDALGAHGEALIGSLVEDAEEGWENAVETAEEIVEDIAETAEDVAEAVVEVAEAMAEAASDVAEEIVEVFEDIWPF